MGAKGVERNLTKMSPEMTTSLRANGNTCERTSKTSHTAIQHPSRGGSPEGGRAGRGGVRQMIWYLINKVSSDEEEAPIVDTYGRWGRGMVVTDGNGA